MKTQDELKHRLIEARYCVKILLCEWWAHLLYVNNALCNQAKFIKFNMEDDLRASTVWRRYKFYIIVLQTCHRLNNVDLISGDKIDLSNLPLQGTPTCK